MAPHYHYLPLPRCVKGVCVALDAQTYRCDCEDGYRGALCNLQGEPAGLCRGLQCLHGQCEETEDGEQCVCEQGYTGESCDIGEEGLLNLINMFHIIWVGFENIPFFYK